MTTITTTHEGSDVSKRKRKGFFARKLKELREAAGLSQAALAELCGVPVPTIRGFEQGWREPNYRTLLKLARGLGVPLSAFEPPEGPPAKRKRK